MNSEKDFYSPRLAKARNRVSLKPFTTLKAGGEALLYFEPQNPEEAALLLHDLHFEEIPFRFLGGGSNVLIPDEGYEGAVVHTGQMKTVLREGERLKVWAGASLPGLVHDVGAAGLTGLEGWVGIPGSVGGAVRMNSGGRYGDFWEVVQEVELATPEGKRKTLNRKDAKPVYRDGGIGDALCLSAVIQLQPGNKKTIQEKTAQILSEKGAAQPLTERSAGCIFKNPPGKSAGKLVEMAGCKGWNEGNAYVSEKHGNFIVNRGGASATEVRKLIERVRQAIRDQFQVELELEIVIW